MNPNYFFDLNYHNPKIGYELFEYSKADPTNSVDFSVFYDESMLGAGLIDEAGMQWVQQYQTVPRFDSEMRPIGLEFDCGSKTPAFFANLHPNNAESREATIAGLAGLLGKASPGLPVLTQGVWLEEAGIFPARGDKFIRLMVRGTAQKLKEFADVHGCVGTDIIVTTNHEPPRNTAVSFDWDGVSVSNVMYASPNIHEDDPWVVEKKAELEAQVAKNYAGLDYSISWVLKMSLSANPPPNYLKLYGVVRTK